MDEQQAKRDAVTVGQIRSRYLKQLDSQINDLNSLIREGYHNQHKAEAYLKDPIGETLKKLDNLNAMASTEVLFPSPVAPNKSGTK